MKKYITSLIILSAMALSLMCFPKYASAEDNLNIKDWTVNAYLLENGNLRISEDITFEFKDKFNGVYRDIVLDKTSGVSDIKVQEVKDGSLGDYNHTAEAKNGDKGVYTLEEGQGKVIIKIFSPSKREKKTFRISYIVNNVAIKYKDTGELYYKFLGNGNETSIERFTVNINLPHEDNSGRVNVFAHGPLNGTIDKINDKLYRLQAGKVPSKTFIEGRVLFPVEFIADSDNVENIDRYQYILDEEASLKTLLEQKRQRRENNRRLFKNITLAFSGISIAAFVLVLHQCKRRVNKEILDIEYQYIPEDCTPALASYITGIFTYGDTMFATILDLFRKGCLGIRGENEAIDTLENKDFTLYKTRDEDISLLEHERFFISWLFDDMGDGETVSTKDMEYYRNHSWQKYYQAQTTWKNKVKAEAEKRGYIDHSKAVHGAMLLVLSGIGIPLGIATAVFGSLYAILGFAVSITLMVYGISLFFRRSDKGYLEYKKWVSFRRYIYKQNPDMYKEDLLNPLDPTLIYALTMSAIKKQEMYPGYENHYAADSWIFWYAAFHTKGSAFSKSMNDSFASGSSSSSGGFSSGGGGGAGGGGAGGF